MKVLITDCQKIQSKKFHSKNSGRIMLNLIEVFIKNGRFICEYPNFAFTMGRNLKNLFEDL